MFGLLLLGVKSPFFNHKWEIKLVSVSFLTKPDAWNDANGRLFPKQEVSLFRFPLSLDLAAWSKPVHEHKPKTFHAARTFRKARFYSSLTQTLAFGKWRVSLWFHSAFMWPQTTKKIQPAQHTGVFSHFWVASVIHRWVRCFLTFSLAWMRRIAVTRIALNHLLVSTYFWAAWQKMCRVSRLLVSCLN